jgi:hypothetical protein
VPATKIFEDDEFSVGDRWKALAWDAPTSVEFPEGLQYGFQYLDPADEKSLKCDNANGAHTIKRHHCDYPGEIESIEFQDLRSHI